MFIPFRADGSLTKLLRRWPRPETETAVRYLDAKRGRHCLMPLFGDNEPVDARLVCGAPPSDPASSWCAACRKIVFTSSTLGGSNARS